MGQICLQLPRTLPRTLFSNYEIRPGHFLTFLQAYKIYQPWVLTSFRYIYIHIRRELL
jgi:hypothetical protein